MEKVKAKKSLGQNFLKDQKVLNKIVEAAELSQNDKVLEIGPGKGALTRFLLERGARLVLVEKDQNLANSLALNIQYPISNIQKNPNDQNYKFPNRKGIVSGDVLEVNLPQLIEQNDFFDYKVVANIPYYITGKIIRLLFETKYSPKLIVLLVQKEVAERICQRPGKMSILAVSVQCFGKPEIIDEVPKESFDPQPKVDSAILKITPHGKEFFKSADEEKEFFKFVKIGFSSPRKTLANNLANGYKILKDAIEEILQRQQFSVAVRAQELSVCDWAQLKKNLDDLKND